MSIIVKPVIDKLVSEADLKHYPPAELPKFKQQLAEQLITRLGIWLMEELEPEVFKKYLKLAEQGEVEVVQEFLGKNVPDYQQKLSQQIEQFGQEFLAAINQVKEMMA